MNRRLVNAGLSLRWFFRHPVLKYVAVGAGVGFSVVGVVSEDLPRSQLYYPFIAHCEEKVVVPNASNLAPRIKLRNELMRTLRPVGIFKTFPVVYGVDGSGKTTAIQSAIGDLECDAVYFNVPSNGKDFHSALCRLLGSSGSSVDSCIVEAAASYFEKNHRPMVLVVDSVENLCAASPASLHSLLVAAKECVLCGTAKVVLICNDSAVTALQQPPANREVWSSFAEPVEVPELSQLEAQHYLTARGVNQEVAKQAVLTLTGGNLHLLGRFVDDHVRGGQTLEGIRSNWFRELTTALEGDHVYSVLSSCQQGLRLLSDKKSVSVREALDYFSGADLRRLIDLGVLSYHSGARGLRLRSKLVETYFGQKFGKT